MTCFPVISVEWDYSIESEVWADFAISRVPPQNTEFLTGSVRVPEVAFSQHAKRTYQSTRTDRIKVYSIMSNYLLGVKAR